MWIVWVFLGLIVGFAAGFTVAAYTQVEMDKKAVSDGVIKLCGKIFVLKEIDL